MSVNILVLGVSDKGGVSIYTSNLIKEIEGFSFYIPRNNSSKKVMSDLYTNALFVEFNQNYSARTFILKLKELDRIVKANNINIIHAHVLRFGLLVAVYKRVINNRIKFVYTGHGSRYTEKKTQIEKNIFKKMENFVNNMSDRSVFIRKYDLNNSLKNKVVSQGKAVLIRTQAQLSESKEEHFSIREVFDIQSKNIIAMVGSVYDIKNPFLFCQIAEAMLQQNLNLTFLWIGEGEMLNVMKDHVTSLGLESNIKFVGFVEFKKIESAWNEVDILLLTSKSEVFPLIILEAFQKNVLVLSSDFNGVDEMIIDGSTGYIFDKNNATQAVQKLNYILKYTNKIDTVKLNALHFYHQNFSSINKMREQYSTIYNEIV
jgi:glycosyltransferase involved in cell wall biosynthesis